MSTQHKRKENQLHMNSNPKKHSTVKFLPHRRTSAMS
jgi:hypothetical protein